MRRRMHVEFMKIGQEQLFYCPALSVLCPDFFDVVLVKDMV